MNLKTYANVNRSVILRGFIFIDKLAIDAQMVVSVVNLDVYNVFKN
jgi:hypothetical protein